MATVRPIAWRIGVRYSLWHLVRCDNKTFVPTAPLTMCGVALPDERAKMPLEDRPVNLDQTCSRCLTQFANGRHA